MATGADGGNGPAVAMRSNMPLRSAGVLVGQKVRGGHKSRPQQAQCLMHLRKKQLTSEAEQR
eukprot:5707056-Prorocentrum_lima.AAC.1